MPPRRRTKVGSACDRCRTQKLKCDIQRPCTLCLRAGVDCQSGTVDQWRSFQSPQAGSSSTSAPRRKRPQRTDQSRKQSRPSLPSTSTEQQQPWSSSTMSLVEGAFQIHNSSTPDSSLITALPGNTGVLKPRKPGTVPVTNPRPQEFQSTITDLVSLLPSREVAALLVDTYFDRVHWFMLIFHQEDFRRDWQAMYDSRDLIESYPNPAFISTFLVVIAIALQYTGSHRQRLLREYGVDPSTLKEKLLSVIRAKLLDIVSLASLEAVQTCVLLGTYYLYHGNPGLAWPVCGCGLRLAQALNLHRRVPSSSSLDLEMQRKYETRKRCWWAIYEIETFCSMSYGYPLSIKDADCDVELLDPLVRTVHSPASFSSTHQCPATLLSYKYLMSKLSVLIKDTLTDLYGIGSYRATGGLSDRSESFNLRNLIRKVSTLDARLKDWKAEIPDLLCLDKVNSQTTYSSVEEMDQDIGAKGTGFENHIYQLQALTLELAYQNTRILIHRPLLTYKMIPSGSSDTDQIQDPFQRSLQTCREAALSTSSIGSTPIFSLAADTYAVTFIGIHTFTAGVMLCILASIESLTVHSHASKMGLRQLLQMQMQLKSTSRSVLAAQGLEVLQRLIKLVLDKEMKEMFTPEVLVNSDIGTMPGIADVPVDPDNIHSMPGFDDLLQGDVFNYVHDPAMSQALCDFDQALSGNDLDISDFLTSGSGFAQEQAWIWGMDSFGQFIDSS